jgi:hypothetical protein
MSESGSALASWMIHAGIEFHNWEGREAISSHGAVDVFTTFTPRYLTA